MAALTSAGVTVNGFYYTGDRPGSKKKVVNVTLVLSSQGGLTNNIPASLFGLSKITDATNFRTSASVLSVAGPSSDGTLLVFYTINTNGNPADQTATVSGYITGDE